MKYLKYLQTANDFESFKNSDDYVLPNVSYVVETEGVSFEPYKEEIIEYHFEIPVESFGFGDVSGRIDGDFADIFTKLSDLIKSYGELTEYGTYYAYEVIPEKKFNITVNGIKALNQMEYYVDDDLISIQIDAPEALGGGNNLNIGKEFVYVEYGIL